MSDEPTYEQLRGLLASQVKANVGLAQKFIAERQRGDQYRRRAQELRRHAQSWRWAKKAVDAGAEVLHEHLAAEHARAGWLAVENEMLRGLLGRAVTFMSWSMGDGPALGPEEYEPFMRVIGAALAAAPAAAPKGD